MRRRGPNGFTVVELLVVVSIIGVGMVVAWPTLSTFMGFASDAGAATAAARTFNRVRDQARRRNRAYLVRFDLFTDASPQGSMTIIEGPGTGCTSLLADPAIGQQLEVVPFGQTPQGNWDGHVEKRVGLRGWEPPGGNDLRTDALTLCLGPDGGTFWRQGAGAVPVPGILRVRVQRFIFQNGWQGDGPMRRIDISFASGAQLGVDA